MRHIEHEHLLIFGSCMAMGWFVFISFWPRMMLYVYKRAILVKGFGEGPVPINTLYVEPQRLFAEPIASQSAQGSNLTTRGVNHDTLVTIGWLDLRKGPQILQVPDMAGRYYSVQFNDPSKNTNFAYVGKRTTGTAAGEFLVSGPRWKGTVPEGMTQICSPNNSVLVIGRTLVASDSDLPAAYALTKQIRFLPFTVRQPNQQRNGATTSV
jgi:hypothetical protein